MPKELEQALSRAYDKGKRKGKLKSTSKGQYVFGSKPMQKWMKEHK
jgi:hypothetical protein